MSDPQNVAQFSVDTLIEQMVQETFGVASGDSSVEAPFPAEGADSEQSRTPVSLLVGQAKLKKEQLKQCSVGAVIPLEQKLGEDLALQTKSGRSFPVQIGMENSQLILEIKGSFQTKKRS